MAGSPCWEYMRCGRQENCPAFPDHGFECWTVKGTVCRGKNQEKAGIEVNSFTKNCPFYQMVTGGVDRLIPAEAYPGNIRVEA